MGVDATDGDDEIWLREGANKLGGIGGGAGSEGGEREGENVEGRTPDV